MTLNKQKKRDLLFASSALSRGCCCSYSRRNSRVSHALTSNASRASSRQGGAERREHVAKRVEREKTESWENGDGVSRIGGAGVEKEHEKP